MMYVFVIKQIRRSKSISTYKLSELTNLSEAYIKDLEGNRKFNPTLDTLGKIADALEVNVKELFYTKLDIEDLREELDARIEMHGTQSPETEEVSKVIDLLLNLAYSDKNTKFETRILEKQKQF